MPSDQIKIRGGKRMKKIFFGILAVVFASGISYAADVQQQDASVGLSVPQIIELIGIDMSETITPGPEDYARDLQVARVVNDSSNQWGQQLIALRSTSPPGHVVERRVYAVAGHKNDAAVISISHEGNIETSWRNSIWGHLVTNGVPATNPDAFPLSKAITSAGLVWMQANWNTLAPGGDSWDNPVYVPVQITGISNNTGNEAAVDNAMYDANNDIGKGFAERTAALELTIFTNAQDGAALYVHGLQPAAQQGILRLEDTYVSVCTEKTYILQNDLEGAYANACSGDVMETTKKTASSIERVEDNPRNNMGGDGNLTATMGANGDVHGGDATDKAYSTWLRIHNQAQHLFEVKMSTKSPRLIVMNLGIANLARYTEGEYTNTLTFTLMPIVG
jgi:hypothetical protein